MSSSRTAAVEEARADIREHAQATVGDLGSLAQEMSGGSEVRDMLIRAAKQTALLDVCIKDTQQSLTASQATAVRLADRVDAANELLKSLPKTTDTINVAITDI
ncbi:hypothetical protein GGF46_003978 [Coemansia sp. RSA 552]|nr:hypothetical protein GGF46_003978 [Coemansia sp. RSA 552]